MSVQDVCELGSLLEGDDLKKIDLEKKVIYLQTAIRTQEGRLQHEISAHGYLKKSHEALINKAKDIYDKIEVNEIKVHKKNEEAITERNKIKDCNVLVKEYMNQESEILGEIDNLKDKISEIEDTFTREIGSIDFEKLNREIKEIEEEEQQCVEKLQIMRKELVELKKKQEKNRIDIINLQRDIKSKNYEKLEIINKIASHNETEKQIIDSTNSILKEKGGEIENLNNYYSELENKKEEKIKLKNDLDKYHILKKNENMCSSAEIRQKKEEKKSLELSIEDIYSKQRRLESDVKDNNDIVILKENEQKERQGILSELYKEIDIQKSKVTSFQPRDTMNELLNKSAVELKEFQKTTNEVKNEINSIRKQLESNSIGNINNIVHEELKKLLIQTNEFINTKNDLIQDLDNFVKEKLKIEKEFKLANSNNEQELIEIEKMNQELVEIIIKKDNFATTLTSITAEIKQRKEQDRVSENLANESKLFNEKLESLTTDFNTLCKRRKELNDEIKIQTKLLEDCQQLVDLKFIESQKLIKVTAFQKEKASEYKKKLRDIEKELEIEDKKFQQDAMEANNIKNKLSKEFEIIKKTNLSLTNQFESLTKKKKKLLQKDIINEEHIAVRNQIEDINIVSREKDRKSMRLRQISSPEKIQKRIFSNMHQQHVESENISPQNLNRRNRFNSQSNTNISSKQLDEMEDNSYNSISEDEYSQPKKKQQTQIKQLSQPLSQPLLQPLYEPLICQDESQSLSPVIARMRTSTPVMANMRQFKSL